MGSDHFIQRDKTLSTATLSTATLIIAASDSLHTERADYVCDGTDDDVQIQAAITALPASGGKIVLLEGNYYPTSSNTLVENLILDLTTAIIHWDTAEILFTLSGSIGVNSALTINASIGDCRLTVADSSGFTAGDYIRVRSENVVGDSRDGEIHKITVINAGGANTVDINGSLWEDYLIADTGKIEIINMKENVEIYDGTILGASPTQVGAYDVALFTFCSNINIHHTAVKDVARRCYIFYHCIDSIVSNNHIEGVAQSGYGYATGVSGACSNINIGNNHFIYNRHSFTGGGLNGSTENGSPKHINFHDNTLENSQIPATACVDLHECSARGISIQDNLINGYGGLNIGAIDWTAMGNTIHVIETAMGDRGNSVKQVSLSNNIISACETGVSLASTSLEEANISNLQISNLSYNAISISGGTDVTLNIDKLIIANGNSAVSDCVYIPANTVKYLNISNSFIHNCQRSALRLVTITGGGAITGNDFANNKQSATSALNRKCALYMSECDNFIITDNKLYDDQGTPTQGYGIGLENCDKTLLKDNMCYGNTIEDIYNSGCIGLEMYNKYTDLLMDVLAVSTTHVRSNEDLSAATPITFTLDAQPDIPRTLSWSFDSHAQITEYDMEVIGIDGKGNSVTETWDETAGWSSETNNAFATVTSIKMTARTGTGAADTMDIGITDVLGLSNIIYETSDVFKIKKNNANATVATAQVNTTYDTYDMSVITLGAGDDFTIWYKSNLNIIS